MTDLAYSNRDASIVAAPLIAPTPRCSINVRSATAADLPFIDALQKMHSHMVGFIPMKQFEKHVGDGNMLVAEEKSETSKRPNVQSQRADAGENVDVSTLGGGRLDVLPIGYVLAKDQYLKRDDVGIVYQLNVMPMRQRHLVGAMLIKAVFEKAAYGCRLFSCWCAQDIQANWFWESIGFVPLAFRTGSRSKQRIHIFWQRRIREGDEGVGATPYWFPSKTEGGAVMEDRIVLPIPVDSHWRDVKPLVLPGPPQGLPSPPTPLPPPEGEGRLLPGGAAVKPRPEQPKLSQAQKVAIQRTQSKLLGGVPLGKKAVITASGIKYVERTDYVAELDGPEELEQVIAAGGKKPKRAPRPRAKHDAEHVKKARELRDRFLEEVNANAGLLPPGWGAQGKYDVSRALEGGDGGQRGQGMAMRSMRGQLPEAEMLDAA